MGFAHLVELGVEEQRMKALGGAGGFGVMALRWLVFALVLGRVMAYLLLKVPINGAR